MTTTEKTPTSTQLARWIAQAEALGLVVKAEETSDYGLQQWSVSIRRPQVDAATALDDYNNARGVHIVATRYPGGRWSHVAHYSGWDYTKIEKLAVVRYAIEGLAE